MYTLLKMHIIDMFYAYFFLHQLLYSIVNTFNIDLNIKYDYDKMYSDKFLSLSNVTHSAILANFSQL